MKIGIFFGGQSREREISFAGGRTVYDNLNKSLFEAVPVFVDSVGNFILLNWQFVYKGTIRDFYPPVSHIPTSPNGFQIYIESLGKLSVDEQDEIISQVGKKIQPSEFSQYFDFAFLALHGPYGEDGNIQGLLEWYGIPYSGCGILSSAIGIDKKIQKELFKSVGLLSPKTESLRFSEWQKVDKSLVFEAIKADLGLPFVVKPPHQGSSIGVSVVDKDDIRLFINAVNRAFFVEEVKDTFWKQSDDKAKQRFISDLIDIRQGIGMPLMYFTEKESSTKGKVLYHPEDLLKTLNEHFALSSESIFLQTLDNEDEVIFEAFIKGKEFSCIVIQDENGKPLPLPPTEILKHDHVFDYRSKYLPGMSRKITPMSLEAYLVRKIQKACAELYEKLHFSVYARIDGFITEKGDVFLNDPNTTSGMLPSSFFFHQAAEIGMNPSQFLTYIIRTSIAQRLKTGKQTHKLRKMLQDIDLKVSSLQSNQSQKVKVGVIMGGYSSERHISVESGRNIYEKLSSSNTYEPIPIFLTGNSQEHQLYIMPISIMLKDNADDIKEKIERSFYEPKHEILEETRQRAKSITRKYAGEVDFMPQKVSYKDLKSLVGEVFIALHGRPGEDGDVQGKLDELDIPYNGSGVESSRTTIDKYLTKEILKQHGFVLANHRLVLKGQWQLDREYLFSAIERNFPYPFIAKPHDDGCSSAVKKINNRNELEAYCRMTFRTNDEKDEADLKILQMDEREEFPKRDMFLLEELISAKGANHFLEITGGLLTKIENGKKVYEMFEPSEALASKGILSLEEKFLAGEGQNITPARFDKNPEKRLAISLKVQEDLRRAAEILNVEGYARIDAFVRIYNDKVETIIIEVNSLPGMTPATCIFHQAAINQYKPYQFIEKILEYGVKKKELV
ncbi:MAG: hypothetical protein OHK0038_08450 [Flammeovirgaceae bacterium]